MLRRAEGGQSIPDDPSFVDKKTGATSPHEGMQKMLAYAWTYNTIVVHTLDQVCSVPPRGGVGNCGGCCQRSGKDGRPVIGALSPQKE